jgi:adenylate cyclase
LVTLGIRRSFLLSSNAIYGKKSLQGMKWLDEVAGVRYTHAFLISEPNKSVGVKIHESGAVLIISSEPEWAMNPRVEYEIPVAEAHHLLSQCQGPRLDRLSKRFTLDSHRWVIDEYLGDNKGLVLAHVELASSEEAFTAPHWLGREVTGDDVYQENKLLSNPYAGQPAGQFDRLTLKPCPFCGCAQSVALTDTDKENLFDPKAWVFQFVRCRVRTSVGSDLSDKAPPNSGCGAMGQWSDTPEEAARAWNKRCQRDVLAAQQLEPLTSSKS